MHNYDLNTRFEYHSKILDWNPHVKQQKKKKTIKKKIGFFLWTETAQNDG